MGDGSDSADIRAFMHSRTGKRRLQSLRRRLLKSLVTSVTFTNETWIIGAEIRLLDGKRISVWLPEFDIQAIREAYPNVFQEADEARRFMLERSRK